MFKNNKDKISAGKIDELIDQSFLELDFEDPKNENLLDALSNSVMLTANYAKPKANQTLHKFLRTHLNILLLGTGLVGSLVYYHYFYRDPIKTEQNATPLIAPTAMEKEIATPLLEQPLENRKYLPKLPTRSMEHALVMNADSIKRETPVDIDLPVYTEPLVFNNKKVVEQPKEDTTYVFPKLTVDEIKANNKQKKRMLETLAKQAKSRYASIPASLPSYSAIAVIPAFYMQISEVTNLEYRTFLFDLLIQSKKDEFIRAKPNQQLWLKESDNEYTRAMSENYFSNSAYNDYPVVNISREGATMYCRWLTKEVKKITYKNKTEAQTDSVRLPTEQEWIYAATAGEKEAVYPWYLPPGVQRRTQSVAGNERIANGRGCFLANFNVKKPALNLNLDSACKCNHGTSFIKATTSAGLMIGEGIFTAPVLSYNPNDFGLYCMSGNVAEMVDVPDPNNKNKFKAGTKGGSWNSDAEHLKFNSADEYSGQTVGSPYIGFRPLITIR